MLSGRWKMAIMFVWKKVSEVAAKAIAELFVATL